MGYVIIPYNLHKKIITSLIQKETFTSYHTFLFVFYKKVATIILVYFF